MHTIDKLYFIPLGGAGEIGMNLNLYQYGSHFLMVDLGISFTDLPGIDVIMPDPEFIIQRNKNLKGIILTHAHEDHIGAIPYLGSLLKCPIYATPFTGAVLRRKLEEQKIFDLTIIEIPLSGTINLSPFEIEFITLTHSIPEPNALAIKTPAGTVIHTGDWKLDPTPLIGACTNSDRLQQYGAEGVLAMVADSTNIFEENDAGSEALVRKNLEEIIQQCRERVIVACFSSNIARLQSCAEIARKYGRTVGSMGRSLQRMEDAARSVGYLKEIPPFLSDSAISGQMRSKTLILATGSQAEPRSALARMAYGTHPLLKLKPGDTVIFSSRIIPGNEKDIYNMQNALLEQGVIVKTHKDSAVHVSGHPSRNELTTMYNWVKPQIAIPVHGEKQHLIAHANLAETLKIPSVVIPKNGDVIELNAQTLAKKVDEVHSGVWGKDGHTIIPLESSRIKERLKIAENGTVFVSIFIKESSETPFEIFMTFLGIHFNDPKDKDHLVKMVYNHCYDYTIEDAEEILLILRQMLKRQILNSTGKKPWIEIHLCA